jgi:hypothetical protein
MKGVGDMKSAFTSDMEM